MGADGGVVWLELKSPDGHAELNWLLEPWLPSLQNLGGGTYEDSRSDWIRENGTATMWEGGYGTDLGYDSPSIDDIPRVVQWVRELIPQLPANPTWADVKLDAETRPAWDPGPGLPKRWLIALGEADEEWLSQPLEGWVGALCSLVVTDRKAGKRGRYPVVNSVETWT